VDHAEDVGGDPPLVAQVELLEGAIVAGADSSDEGFILVAVGSRGREGEGCG
jgi:hypothetical protein